MNTMLKLTNEKKIVSLISDAGETMHPHANKLSWTLFYSIYVQIYIYKYMHLYINIHTYIYIYPQIYPHIHVYLHKLAQVDQSVKHKSRSYKLLNENIGI